MKVGIRFERMDEMISNLAAFGSLGEQNFKAATMDTALEIKEILADATRSPRSNKVASAARFWRVVNRAGSVWIVNPNEIAAYLEWGTGIFNEGPGLKDKIRPRRSLLRFGQAYADRLWKVKKEVAPFYLTWKDKQGRWHRALEVEGMRPVRMVRDNLPHFRQIYEYNVLEAVRATVRGERYA